jgi:hypothetical protein
MSPTSLRSGPAKLAFSPVEITAPEADDAMRGGAISSSVSLSSIGRRSAARSAIA